MLKYLGVFVILLFISQNGISQEVSGYHDIQPGNGPNEYNIKTTIKGLKGVDIAKINYIIGNKHTFKATSNNPLFSDRNESYIKFYIMAVPVSGILTIELGVLLADGADYSFPVEFQFSKNEVKQSFNLPKIILSGGETIIAVMEETEVIEVPEQVASLISNEPEVIETLEPIAEVKVIETATVVNSLSTKFTVQLLSLSNFSQSRLNNYCKQYNLPVSKITKRNVGTMVKITYGEVSSIQEARELNDQLVRDYGINDSFVTSIK